MKRRDDGNHMSKEEYESREEEEDAETAGSFKRADADILAGRKIIKTKRSSTTSFGSDPMTAQTIPTFSTDVPKAFNPFANIQFGGFTANNKDFTKEPESVKPAPASTFTMASLNSHVNAAATIPTFGVSSQKILNTSNGESDKHKQIRTNPVAIWKEGVKDYIKYTTQLKTNSDDVVNDASQSSTITETSNPFSLSSTSTLEKAAPATATPFTGFTIPNTFLSASNPTPTFSGFSAIPSQISLESKPTVNASTPSYGSTFGGFQTTSNNSTNPFSSQGFTLKSNDSKAQDDDEGDGEEEPILAPEVVERNPDDTDEILLDVKCKLFRYEKNISEWKDGGKGSFRITRDPSTQKTRMLIRNTMGKISLNSAFYKGMKFDATGGKGIRFAAVCGDDAVMQSLMIKMNTADVPIALKLLESQVETLA